MTSLIRLAALSLALSAGATAQAQEQQCDEDRFAHGSWIEPGLQPGSFQGAMLDAQGSAAYLLDTELTRYVFSGDQSDYEFGGMYGQLTSVLDPSAADVQVIGGWSRQTNGLGSFSAVLLRATGNAHVPLIAIGNISGQFGMSADDLLDVPVQPGTDTYSEAGGSADTGIGVSASQGSVQHKNLDGLLKGVAGIPPTLDDPGSGGGLDVQVPGIDAYDEHGGDQGTSGGLDAQAGSEVQLPGVDSYDDQGGNQDTSGGLDAQAGSEVQLPGVDSYDDQGGNQDTSGGLDAQAGSEVQLPGVDAYDDQGGNQGTSGGLDAQAGSEVQLPGVGSYDEHDGGQSTSGGLDAQAGSEVQLPGVGSYDEHDGGQSTSGGIGFSAQQGNVNAQNASGTMVPNLDQGMFIATWGMCAIE